MKYAAVENHYGYNYVLRVDSEQDTEDIIQTYETCFDSDWITGLYDTEEDAKQHVKDSTL